MEKIEIGLIILFGLLVILLLILEIDIYKEVAKIVKMFIKN